MKRVPKQRPEWLRSLGLTAVLALGLAACTGDAVVDVDPEPDPPIEVVETTDPTADSTANGTGQGVPFLRLGEDAGGSAGQGGSHYHVENGLITVNGLIFSSGHGADGNMALNFFFGYANRRVYSGGQTDSVNVGLFVYSDQPFEGAVQAGAFEGQELRFSIDGFDVVVASRADDGTPLLGDGSRTPAWVLHIDNFFWTTSSGRIIYNAIGAAPELRYIVDLDRMTWEFDIDQGVIYVNGEELGSVAGLKQDPFEWFFVYGGPDHGGLFVVTDHAFGELVEAGAFEGQELNFEINGFTVRLTSEAPTLLGAGARTPAWVLHKPDFVMRSPAGVTTGPIFGVTSSLEQLLARDVSGSGAATD